MQSSQRCRRSLAPAHQARAGEDTPPMDYWLAFAIGAGSGGLLLALFARLPAKALAQQGFLALNAMLAIYVGAQLVSGTLNEIIFETVFAVVAAGLTQVTMLRWLPAIGIAIALHGVYDAALGPHTGVAEWYPPLCAGFDFVVGVGLIALLIRKQRAGLA